MTNKELIEEWRKDYGEDSDFFKVRVRGLFPSTSEVQFIPQAYVDEAMSRTLEPGSYTFASKIIGVDPAYTGSDEASIYLRQGLHARLLGTYPKTDDDVKFAQIVAGFEDEHKADAVFIDFGYGTGIHSIGRSWGRKWQLVNFGGESKDPGMLNKRGEMWNSMKSWLKEGGSIDDQQTADEIVAPEYRVKLDGRIVLEAKDDMKRRGVPSPNRADALALTFAFPVPESGKHWSWRTARSGKRRADICQQHESDFAAKCGSCSGKCQQTISNAICYWRRCVWCYCWGRTCEINWFINSVGGCDRRRSWSAWLVVLRGNQWLRGKPTVNSLLTTRTG